MPVSLVYMIGVFSILLIKRDRQPGTGPDWRINYVTAYSNTCTGRAQVCGICLFVAYNTTRFGPAGPSFFRVPPLAVAPANAPCPVPKRFRATSERMGQAADDNLSRASTFYIPVSIVHGAGRQYFLPHSIPRAQCVCAPLQWARCGWGKLFIG